MEPLDTDYVATQPRPAFGGSRVNVLLILPAVGLILMLIFIAAAIFQLNLSDLIDSLVGFLLLLFVVMVGMLFWAFAPRASKP